MRNILTMAMTAVVLSIISCGESADNVAVDSDTVSVKAPEPAVAVDTVNSPRLVMAESDGAYLLTAENGKAVGPNIKYMPEWKAFGWFTSDDKVEWEVDVTKSGKYNVFLEWSVSDEEAGKEFIIEAGNEELTGTVKKSGSWETYKNEKIGNLNLKEGKQVIVFRSKTKFKKDGALMDLRNLRLVPAG